MTARTERVEFASKNGVLQVEKLLAILIGLALVFQVGHFVEHGVQFVVWISGKYEWVVSNFCGRGTPFMSRPVTEIVSVLGEYLFPEESIARQTMMGMEILHLIGNSIFLASIVGLTYFIRTKWVRYALYIESAHLCEHISLTLSAYYLGKPIGLSTLFGQASLWLGSESAVGWRVSWHFFMNLLPMPFVMIALMQQWSARRQILSLGGSGQKAASGC